MFQASLRSCSFLFNGSPLCVLWFFSNPAKAHGGCAAGSAGSRPEEGHQVLGTWITRVLSVWIQVPGTSAIIYRTDLLTYTYSKHCVHTLYSSSLVLSYLNN